MNKKYILLVLLSSCMQESLCAAAAAQSLGSKRKEFSLDSSSLSYLQKKEAKELFFKAAREGNVDSLKRYGNPKSINSVDFAGMTALMHLAASKTGDHVIAASYLLQQKADIDIKGPGNKQALDYAIDNEHTAITLCLLKRLPRPEKALFIAETALMVALKSKNIQDPLVQRLVHQEIKNDTNTSFNMAHLNGNRKLCKQILSAHEFFFEQRKKEEEPSVEQLSVKRKELDQIDMPSKSRHCKDKEVAYNAPVKKSGFYRFSLAVIASRLTILPSKKCTEPDDIKALGYDMAFLALDDSSFNS